MTRFFLTTPLIFLLSCAEKEFSKCDFVDICRDGDAFQCKDDLFYAVHPEYGLQYVAETTEELQAYCCPDDFVTLMVKTKTI